MKKCCDANEDINLALFTDNINSNKARTSKQQYILTGKYEKCYKKSTDHHYFTIMMKLFIIH